MDNTCVDIEKDFDKLSEEVAVEPIPKNRFDKCCFLISSMFRGLMLDNDCDIGFIIDEGLDTYSFSIGKKRFSENDISSMLLSRCGVAYWNTIVALLKFEPNLLPGLEVKGDGFYDFIVKLNKKDYSLSQ